MVFVPSRSFSAERRSGDGPPFRGIPGDSWPRYAEQFVHELVAHTRRAYPGRDVTRRAPPLPRPKRHMQLQELREVIRKMVGRDED